jgi:hypothetical protein
VIPLATQLDRLIDRLEQMSREVAEVKRAITLLTPVDPRLRLGITQAQEFTDDVIADAYFGTLRGGIQLAEDTPGNFRTNVVEPIKRKPAQAKKLRTKAQKKNDKLQSKAFQNANAALRKTNGQMRKGITQRDIAARAQRELRKLKKGTTKRAKRGGTSKRSSRSR